MEDSFDSSIPLPELEVVLSVCVKRNIDPTSSPEAESFFLTVIREANQNGVNLNEAIRESLNEFRSVSAPPPWIQNPDWQFTNNRPMVFVGHIDVPAQAGQFHDEARFFVFWDPETGATKTLVQVA